MEVLNWFVDLKFNFYSWLWDSTRGLAMRAMIMVRVSLIAILFMVKHEGLHNF